MKPTIHMHPGSMAATMVDGPVPVQVLAFFAVAEGFGADEVRVVRENPWEPGYTVDARLFGVVRARIQIPRGLEVAAFRDHWRGLVALPTG